ncbi:uncharacterized protein JCM15063_004248 [Sporobolomyces koalae]|uniref:uncharacterized protein n=1 Tax=Sporobolomyces koalae TaxID=500713 RepID=UPI00316D26AF
MSSTPPQTPPRSQASSRVPSHLSSQADQISFQLSKLVTILQQATNQLSSLIPASNAPQLPPKELRSTQRHRTRAGLHGPTASISELQRHASRALQEREEVEQWELGSAASDPSVGLANSAASASVVPPIDRFTRSEGVSRNDPFHPTDTYFGGLERKSSTRSNTSTASGQDRLSTPAGARGHRLRPSVGTVGAFGIGTAAGSGSPSMRDHGGRSRRRPASVGGWIDHTSPVPPSPLARTLGTNDDATNAKDPEGDLQELWDAAHGLRKGFIWTLIAVCEESDIDGKNRQDLGAVLVELVNNLRQIATQIETLRQQSCLEPDCAASSRIGSNAQPPPFRALPSQKLDRNESAISGILAADPTPSAPSLQNHSARRHLGHRSTISLEPHSPPDFGPPSSAPAPTAQALARYESQHVTLSDTLRTLQSSLGSVLSEARLLSPLSPLPLSDSPAVETRNLEARRRLEAVLEKHDTIKEELEKLALEWAESRVTLRQALGIELFKTDPSTQRKMGLGIQAEWETKADILHELGSNDTPPNRPKPEGSSDAALDDGQATPELDLVSRQALLDAALSMSLQPQEREDEREKIFEAVAGEKRDRTPGAEKLSREERIRRMKEGREALDAGKRAASVSEGGGGIAEQQRMVGELRQVLEGREKRRNTEGDPESTSSSS